jgi:hypothetical protein
VWTSNVWSGAKAYEYNFVQFLRFEAKHQGHNCSSKWYFEHYIRSSTNPLSTCYRGPIQHLGETFDWITCCRWRL